jgi:S1-C subfamily serine protease
LNPGNSGGPLFDAYGNVVGIVESKLMYDTNVDGEKIPLDGIAYAIPINAAKSKIVEWIETDLTKPMLGIHAISVEENVDYFYSAAEGKIYLYVNEQGKNYSINAVGEKKELTDAQINDPENMIVHADKTGLLVVGITEGLGAYGKLERGDILVELNGEPTSNTAEVRAIFTKLSAGDTVDVKVYRNGEPLVMKMTLKTKGDMLAAEYDK